MFGLVFKVTSVDRISPDANIVHLSIVNFCLQNTMLYRYPKHNLIGVPPTFKCGRKIKRLYLKITRIRIKTLLS